MSVSKISVCLNAVYMVDKGSGEWRLFAGIDGKPVGDSNQIFEAHGRQWISLPANAWSTAVDVDDKGPGSTVQIQFQVLDRGKDLGTLKAVLKYPFKQDLNLIIPAEKTGGGIFSSAHSRYTLNLVVKVVQEKATIPMPGKADFFVNRQADGTETFSTLSGAGLKPRVEICPVVPVPGVKSLPPRPEFPAAFAAGKATAQAATVPLSPQSSLNALPNPAVIPILSKTDPDMAAKAARIAVTYIEPGNLDTSLFTWSIKSGPAAFSGGTPGKTEVLVYGTGAGASDVEAIIELRWDKGGPVLSTYRALVGNVKEIPYRALILNPSAAAHNIQSAPSDVQNHIAIANVLLWQAGLKLVADRDPNGNALKAFDGAKLEQDAIFSLALPHQLDAWTRDVDTTGRPPAARLNFVPGVLNIVYVKSTVDNVVTEIDRPLLDGRDATDTGSPSTSWEQPSGVPPDGDAASVIMHTNAATNRQPQAPPPQPGRLDGADDEWKYLKKRVLPSDAMTQLFTVLIPDYSSVGPSDPNYGVSLAHATCRVLGLLNRGYSFDGGGVASEDGINHPNGMGYPMYENLMSPAVFDWSQDLDILQAKVLREHPLVNPPLPALGVVPFAAGFDQGVYPGDHPMKVWSLASPYAFVCYYLRSPGHPNHSWMGQRATLLEQGWKMLPTYVGQQHNNLTTAQGNTDGADAADRMATEQFPQGTYVFLDVESQVPWLHAMSDYITAWVTTVASGDYRPGVYCTRGNAADVQTAVNAGLAAVVANANLAVQQNLGAMDAPAIQQGLADNDAVQAGGAVQGGLAHANVQARYWITGGVPYTFSVNLSPTAVGIDYADARQSPEAFPDGIHETYGTVTIAIDQDVAGTDDPAGPDNPNAP